MAEHRVQSTFRDFEIEERQRVDKPAIIICEDQRGGLKVASLTVLDRLLVALHRGGCNSLLVVTRAELPALKRARALGITWQTVETLNSIESPSTDFLLARGHLLIQAGDVARVLQHGATLVGADGEPLLLHLAAGAPLAVPERMDGRTLFAEGVARHVSNAAEARQAVRTLWASLKSSSDGIVDRYFNRPVGRPLSRLLIHTPISPNQISVASSVIGVAGAWFLAGGTPAQAVLGAILFQVSAIVDCVDGDVARMIFKESRLGKWLDLVGDQVVHSAVFVGIGVGLARSGSDAPIGWLVGSAVAGALLSFAVVLRGMPAGAKGNGKLQALLDRATNRDFSVLVLVLAALNSLEWFLWMAALGSHAFWALALMLQWHSPAATTKRLEPR